MGSAARWLAAVAAGVLVFEALDAVSARGASWLPLVSPIIAGAVAAWGGGGGAASRLLAAAAAAWARIGVDLAIGLAHGVRQPPEVEIVVAALFGLPWMVMAVAGGIGVLLLGRRVRR